MITIYGVLRSRATRPVWLMKEIGKDYRLQPVIQAYRLPDPSAPDAPFNTQSAEFLAINPQGLVPCLQDGDTVLTESLAITLYLARAYGGELAAQGFAEEGEVAMWTLVGATGVETPALDILFTHARGEAATPEGAARIAAARTALAPALRRIEGHLAGRDWLVGGRFTVADINLAECLRYATAEADLIDAHPATRAWLSRCHARPAFKAMWAERDAEPA
jgi:glutathione S-transferase